MAAVWENTCEPKFLLENLECYNDSQIKAYDISDVRKLTAELKITTMYGTKITYITNLLYWSLSWAWLPVAHTYGNSNRPHEDCGA